jgi:hypothetical protein
MILMSEAPSGRQQAGTATLTSARDAKRPAAATPRNGESTANKSNDGAADASVYSRDAEPDPAAAERRNGGGFTPSPSLTFERKTK